MPPLRNTPRSFGLVSVLLHWVTAVAVLGLFACGFWMVDLSYYDPLYTVLPQWHEVVGLALVAITALRLIWRGAFRQPQGAATESRSQRALATFAHIFLLFGLVVVMASGYLISTAGNAEIDVFGWFTVPPLIDAIDNQEDIAGYWHWLSAWALIALVAAHSAAALWHQYARRDNTLGRMLVPGSTLTPDTPKKENSA